MKILAVTDPGDFQARMEAQDQARQQRWEQEILDALSRALAVQADKARLLEKLRDDE